MDIKEQIDMLVKYMHTVPHDSERHRMAAETIRHLNKKDQQSDDCETTIKNKRCIK